MNKGIEQVLSPIHRIMANKEKQENTEKGNQVRELQLLVRRVILSKYMISKIPYKDLDVQIQGVRTPNECVRIKEKVHVRITCEHIVIQL